MRKIPTGHLNRCHIYIDACIEYTMLYLDAPNYMTDEEIDVLVEEGLKKIGWSQSRLNEYEQKHPVRM